MLHACLEKAPRTEQAYCLQTPGHPGSHQAYVKDTLIEWEPLLVDDAAPEQGRSSSTAA